MSYKDYYVVLGVLPDAEEVVIKAAYRALVQRYHPDKYAGDSSEAQRKTTELNEAYEVLSNPVRRAEYDRQRINQTKNETISFDDDTVVPVSFDDLNADWELATRFYPDLIQLESRLIKISSRLGIGFKLVMIESKEFEQRHHIAKALEKQYLENYFGTNPKIIEFAAKLLIDGKREAAKELNKTIVILGSKVDGNRIIDKLTCEYYREEIAQQDKVKKIQDEMRDRLLTFFLLIILGIFTLASILDGYETRKDAERLEKLKHEHAQEQLKKQNTKQQQFVDNGDGTVTDIGNGLMWMKCSLGQEYFDHNCVGSVKSFPKKTVSHLTLSYFGKSDWRLPSKQEQASLHYCSSGFSGEGDSCSDDTPRPYVNSIFFPNTSERGYWNEDFISSGYFTDAQMATFDMRFDFESGAPIRLVRNVVEK
jgi:curved DNA-binding protein CbpA